MIHKKPYVSIVIPTYRDWDNLKACLQALGKQSYPQDSFEIIVVNNDPESSPPPDLLRSHNSVFLIEAKPGSYAARNCGIAKAQGEILAFLDADCTPEREWLEQGVNAFSEGERISLLAGQVELTFGGRYLSPAECFEKAYAFRQRQNADNGVSVTANLLVRRRVFDEVGLFDETLMSGGDFEWTRRATRQGKRIIYAGHCCVRHPARASLKALSHKARRVSTGSMVLYQERRPLGGLCRVMSNIYADLKAICSRSDMTCRERSWAVVIMGYLKAVKLHQRLGILFVANSKRQEQQR